MPLLDQADFTLLSQEDAAPLDRALCFLLNFLDALEGDKQVRLVFSVMSFKCEYVGPLAQELKDQMRNKNRLCDTLEKLYAHAKADGSLRPGLSPRIAALETITFIAGLLRLWLLDEGADGVREHARELVSAHIDAKRSPILSR